MQGCLTLSDAAEGRYVYRFLNVWMAYGLVARTITIISCRWTRRKEKPFRSRFKPAASWSQLLWFFDSLSWARATLGLAPKAAIPGSKKGCLGQFRVNFRVECALIDLLTSVARYTRSQLSLGTGSINPGTTN